MKITSNFEIMLEFYPQKSLIVSDTFIILTRIQATNPIKMVSITHWVISGNLNLNFASVEV